MSQEKKKLMATITMDTPVDEMPDCPMKFEKILLEAQKENKLFTDAKFKADNTSLGE